MESLLTVREAADLMRISESTLYRYCTKKLLPNFKKSFGIRIRHSDLKAWLEKDKKKAALDDVIIKNALTTLPSIANDKAKGGQKVARKKTRHNYCYGSVYIRKTKKGIPRYYIDYYDRNQNRIQKLIKHATNWNEAHEALKNAILKEHYSEHGIQKKRNQIKFKKFVEMFIEDYNKVNKRSWKDDSCRLKKLSEFFGNINLNEVSPIKIERFKSHKLKKGIAKSTINRYLSILKRLFNVAIEWEYAKNNPVRKVKLYSEKDNLKERILTEEEEVRLLKMSSEHLRPILIVALNTGMRRGEILNLKWSNIDFKAEEIKIVNTKSGKSRIVDINSRLLNELLKLRKKNQNSQYVFTNPRTGKPYKKLQTSFDGACRRAKIEELRFHDLRHTAASRLVEKGVDIIRVKELLGHSSVRITERYTHSSREERKRAVEFLCQKSLRKDQKRQNLLHMRYMRKDKNQSEPIISLFSLN